MENTSYLYGRAIRAANTAESLKPGSRRMFAPGWFLERLGLGNWAVRGPEGVVAYAKSVSNAEPEDKWKVWVRGHQIKHFPDEKTALDYALSEGVA